VGGGGGGARSPPPPPPPAEARHPLLVFLDDDIVPDKNLLAAHASVQRDAREKDVLLGYCPPAVEGARLWELFLRESWEDYYRRLAEPQHQWTYMDFASGNVSLPLTLFLVSGGFDEDFERRNEDPDFGIRLLENGARFSFDLRARAAHELDTRFSAELYRVREAAKSDVLLSRKRPEIKGRLGGVAGMLRPEGFSSRALLAHRHAAAGERLAPLALLLLYVLERLRLRREWHALTSALLAHSYVLGLADALPTHEQLLDFVASIRTNENGDVIPVYLDEPTPLRLPPTSPSAVLELDYAGLPLVRVAAVEAGGVWDWETLTRRVAAQALRRAQEVMELDDLLELLRPAAETGGGEPNGRGDRAESL
jgi:hypothetical protein